MIHQPAQHFVQVVENALYAAFQKTDLTQWERVHKFYESRYLNPDSPEKHNLYAHTNIGKNSRP